MAKATSEPTAEEKTTAILNRASVHLAEQRRLADSWFSSLGSTKDAKADDAHEEKHGRSPLNVAEAPSAKDEVALEARSERLGLGATPVKDWRRGPLSKSLHGDSAELNALRQQISGNRNGHMGGARPLNGDRRAGAGNNVSATNGKKRPHVSLMNGAWTSSSESEDEGGRASAVGKRSRAKQTIGTAKSAPQLVSEDELPVKEKTARRHISPLETKAGLDENGMCEEIVPPHEQGKVSQATLEHWHKKSRKSQVNGMASTPTMIEAHTGDTTAPSGDVEAQSTSDNSMDDAPQSVSSKEAKATGLVSGVVRSTVNEPKGQEKEGHPPKVVKPDRKREKKRREKKRQKEKRKLEKLNESL